MQSNLQYLRYIEKYGEDKILYLKKGGLDSISDKLINFGETVFLICQNCCQ